MQYFLAHWRGELSLTKSVLLNGVIAYFIFLSAYLGGFQFIPYKGFVYFVLVVFIGWTIWAVVGIVRCAFRIISSNHPSRLRRVLATFAAIVAVICALAFLIVTAEDVFYLFT
jgi:hypothetical protein